MEGIQIQIEKIGRQQQIAALKITGYIDTTTASELERAIQNLLQEGVYRLVVDLAGVDYISSAGWGIFISEIKNIRGHRGDLKLASMSAGVNEVYELLEFATILASVPSVEAAVRDFEGAAPESGKAVPKSSAADVPPPPAAPSAPRVQPPSPAAPAPKPAAAPVPQPSATPGPVQESAPKLQTETLMDRVREVIREHPAWGAWKIKRALNQNRGTHPKVGWSRIRAALSYHGLARKADRIKLAQGRQ